MTPAALAAAPYEIVRIRHGARRVPATGDRLELSRRRPEAFRFGVLRERDLVFFGDRESAALFATGITRLERMGGTRVEIDFGPFREAARLLYEGPWVAERLAALKEFYTSHSGALLQPRMAVSRHRSC